MHTLKQQLRPYLAELLGTFGLVFAGTGAIIINQQTNGSITHVGIALTFGLVVMAMIYAFGDISGAHLNPAVTIALAVRKLFAWKKVAPYIFCQCIGAVLASSILFMLFPTDVTHLGATQPLPEVTSTANVALSPAMRAFVLEAILTAYLMFTILGVTSGGEIKGALAGAAIGALIGLEAMFAGPACGASMNPARSLAPALISGHFEHLWIYLTAPIVGSVFAACLWPMVGDCCAVENNESASNKTSNGQ
jgi:aquaporin NIP